MRGPRPSRLVTAAAALVLAVAVSACDAGGAGGTGVTDDPDASDGPDAVDWPSAGEPLAVDGLVWAADGTVHLPDGTRVVVGDATRETGDYVVAGGGVWFRGYRTPADVPAGAEDLGPADALHVADATGRATEVGIGVDSLAASPDGRYVALIDLTSGPEDRYGTPLAEVVVVEAATGAEVLRSADGMGDPRSDDLAALYPDAEIEVLGFADGRVWVETAEGLRTFDPATGDSAEGERDAVPAGAPWLEVGGAAPPGVDPERWRALSRLSDGTLVGVVPDPGTAGGVLTTCAVPAGPCAPVEGSAGRVVRLPAGTAADEVVDLAEVGAPVG
ncbi:hypothetical protein ACOACO_04560 [Nocardioides sp. CPCC 205120]|uniref:hypothetical protein n=1 Tax=Nocardioides sp. CPCC 205120 TaxID=3406462 RepID=UPI003B502597